MPAKGTTKRKRWVHAVSSDKAAKRRFEALHHPWRIRIVEVLSERAMSVRQFVDEALLPELAEMRREKAISDVAYHFRALRHAGILEVVEQNSRRGSTELVCRALEPAYHTDAEWAELPVEERRPITEMTLDGLMARARAAILFDTFDARTNRHLASVPMEVDEQGWGELVDAMAEMLGTVVQIKHDAKKRLEGSGAPPVRVTWGQLGFESPPLPVPAND